MKHGLTREERWEQLCKTISFPQNLPVSRRSDDIVAAISEHPVVIIAGETGSGKTTQVPKCALLAGLGKTGRVMVTQPRRLAATRTALRIAEELKVTIGEEVGYRIRFQHKSSDDSLLEVVTDGIPLSGDLSGRPFDGFDAVIVDEVHERSVNIDLLLGLLKREREHNPTFKVLLMSATLNTERYSSFFPEAHVMQVEGRTFPVDIEYRERPRGQNLADHLCHTLEEAVERTGGDILCFLPTERDIRDCERKAEGRFGHRIECLPLYSRLSQKEQDRVFKSGAGRQRIILSTNIAETSITLPSVKCVIDSGLVRLLRFQSGRGVPLLEVESISKASARQRTGRAGRTSSGLCLRLYSERDYLGMEDYTLPEIQRQDLAQVILKLISMGVHQPETFPFPDKPSSKSMKSGQRQLEFLGAVSQHEHGLELTTIGREMAKQPLAPRLAHLMLKAKSAKALDEIAVISAFLSMQDPRQNPADQLARARDAHRRFQAKGSDLLTIIDIYQKYRHEAKSRSVNSLRRWCGDNFLSWRRMKEWEQLGADLVRTIAPRTPFNDPENVDEIKLHRLVLGSHLDHLLEIDTKAEDGSYHSLGRHSIFVHPSSALAKAGADWAACTSFLNTSRLFALQNFWVDPKWVSELAPQLIQVERGEARYDSKTQKVVSSETHRFRSHVVKTIANKDHFPWNETEATEVFCREAIVRGELEYPPLDPFRALQSQLENFDAALRVRGACANEDRLVDAWVQQLKACSRFSDFKTLPKSKFKMDIEQLLDSGEKEHWGTDLPMDMNVGDETCPCRYIYTPGKAEDGMTLVLTTTALAVLQQRDLERAVPLWFEERLRLAYETLPKAFKRQFDLETCRQAWNERWEAGPNQTFKQTLERWMTQHTSLKTVIEQWMTAWESKCEDYLTPQLALRSKKSEADDELEQRGRSVEDCQVHNFSAMERKHLIDLKKRGRSNCGSATEHTISTLERAMAILSNQPEDGEEHLDLRGQPFRTYPRIYLHREQCWVEPEKDKAQAERESLITLARLHGPLSDHEPEVNPELLGRLAKVVPDLHEVKNRCTQASWEVLWLRVRKSDLKDLKTLRARIIKCENKYWQRDLEKLLDFCEVSGDLRRRSKMFHPQTSQENWLFRQCAKASFHGRVEPEQWVNRDMNHMLQRIEFLKALLTEHQRGGQNFDALVRDWRHIEQQWQSCHQHQYDQSEVEDASTWLEDLFPEGLPSADQQALDHAKVCLSNRDQHIKACEQRLKDAQQWLMDAEDDLQAELQAKARNRKKDLLTPLLEAQTNLSANLASVTAFCDLIESAKEPWSKCKGQKKRVLEEEKTVGSDKLKSALLTAWGGQNIGKGKVPHKARR